jgi:NAD(P)-dependent dehydrogenase (short-subunit alcohol dehydrogenase family)
MKGKTVVITGANRGIGRIMTRELARMQARVIMACRSIDHAAQVREQIIADLGSVDLEARELDLASFDSVRRFVSQLQKDITRIDALINNAGVSLKKPEHTASGVEMTFAINVLGPQLLTGMLTDQLRAAASARVVFVASDFAGGMKTGDLQFKGRRFNGTKAYKQSKQANRMLAREWARRLEKDRIWVNSMGPGLMPDTDLFRHASVGEKRFMRFLGKLIGVTVEEGADTAIWLACDPELDGETGGYYQKRKKKKCKFFNPEKEKDLWVLCQNLLKNS